MNEPLAEDLEFLQQAVVKGMKWGVRRTRRIQGHIDRVAKVRDGTATRGEKVRVAAVAGIVTPKGAATVLTRGANMQAKIEAGKFRATNILLKAEGIRVADLNYRHDA